MARRPPFEREPRRAVPPLRSFRPPKPSQTPNHVLSGVDVCSASRTGRGSAYWRGREPTSGPTSQSLGGLSVPTCLRCWAIASGDGPCARRRGRHPTNEPPPARLSRTESPDGTGVRRRRTLGDDRADIHREVVNTIDEPIRWCQILFQSELVDVHTTTLRKAHLRRCRLLGVTLGMDGRLMEEGVRSS